MAVLITMYIIGYGLNFWAMCDDANKMGAPVSIVWPDIFVASFCSWIGLIIWFFVREK